MQESLAIIRYDNSSLISISKSPFFKIIAPTWLLEELNKKVPIVANDKNIDEHVLREAVDKVLQNINIVEITNDEAYILARKILGNRDPEGKDAPYVALYLSIKSYCILTADKDIGDQKVLKTFNKVGYAGQIVSTLERGSISFMILGKGLPIVLEALYEVIVAILNGFWVTLKSIGNALLTIANAGVETISQLPEWVIFAMGIVVIFIFLFKEARDFISYVIESLRETILEMLKATYEMIKEIFKEVLVLVQISGRVFEYLFEQIDSALKYYENINPEPYKV